MQPAVRLPRMLPEGLDWLPRPGLLAAAGEIVRLVTIGVRPTWGVTEVHYTGESTLLRPRAGRRSSSRTLTLQAPRSP